MTIADYLHMFYIDVPEHCSYPMFSIDFLNNGKVDTVQFTCETAASFKEDLEDLFEEFCAEEGCNTGSVMDIEFIGRDNYYSLDDQCDMKDLLEAIDMGLSNKYVVVDVGECALCVKDRENGKHFDIVVKEVCE